MAYETKYLVLKKFGWKRICQNTQKFGWILDDAYQHDETTVTTTYTGEVINDKIEIKENVNKSTKVRVHLSFYRDSSRYNNLNKIMLLEVFYNMIFFLRRILAFILPIMTAVAALIFLLGHGDTLLTSTFGGAFGLTLLIWICFIIAENILAQIAYSKLELK